jgi:hypothetical protein
VRQSSQVHQQVARFGGSQSTGLKSARTRLERTAFAAPSKNRKNPRKKYLHFHPVNLLLSL